MWTYDFCLARTSFLKSLQIFVLLTSKTHKLECFWNDVAEFELDRSSKISRLAKRTTTITDLAYQSSRSRLVICTWKSYFFSPVVKHHGHSIWRLKRLLWRGALKKGLSARNSGEFWLVTSFSLRTMWSERNTTPDQRCCQFEHFTQSLLWSSMSDTRDRSTDLEALGDAVSAFWLYLIFDKWAKSYWHWYMWSLLGPVYAAQFVDVKIVLKHIFENKLCF